MPDGAGAYRPIGRVAPAHSLSLRSAPGYNAASARGRGCLVLPAVAACPCRLGGPLAAQGAGPAAGAGAGFQGLLFVNGEGDGGHPVPAAARTRDRETIHKAPLTRGSDRGTTLSRGTSPPRGASTTVPHQDRQSREKT